MVGAVADHNEVVAFGGRGDEQVRKRHSARLATLGGAKCTSNGWIQERHATPGCPTGPPGRGCRPLDQRAGPGPTSEAGAVRSPPWCDQRPTRPRTKRYE